MAAGAPNQISITFDAADVEAGTKQFKDLLGQQINALKNAQLEMLRYNEAGKLISGTVSQQVDATTKIVRTLAATAAGFSETASKVVQDTKKIAESIRQAREQAAQIASKQGAQLFPAPNTNDVNKINIYNLALLRMGQAAAAAKIPASQLNTLLAQAAENPRKFAAGVAAMDPALQAAARQIAQLANASQNLGVVGSQANSAWTISFQGLVRLLEAQVIRRGISAIINALRDGIKTASEYQIKLQQVSNVAGLSQGGTNVLQGQVRQVSEKYALPINQVLGASQTALTSQLGDTAKAFSVLDQAAKLSIATGTDFDASVKLITTSLQAYNLSGTDSARVTNVLLAAAKQTRIPIEDLQNSIGRLGVIATRLNISLEESVAGFITLANQGTRPTEAIALLNATLGHLLAPSRALKEEFQKLGGSTAEVVFAGKNLGQILDTIVDITSKSPDKFAELTGGLRGLRGALGITADDGKKFADALGTIELKTVNLNEAVARSLETPAQKMRQQVQQLKNFFTIDLGQSLLRTASNIVEVFGGLEGTIKTFANAIKILVGTFIGYRIAVTAATFSTASFGQGFAAMGGWTTIAITGIAALTSTLVAYNQQLDQIRAQNIADAQRKLAESTRKANEDIDKSTSDVTNNYKKTIYDRLQSAFDFQREQIRIAQEVRDQEVLKEKEKLDQVRISTGAYADELRKRQSDIRKVITESENEEKASRKRLETYRQQTEAKVFQQQFRLESDPRAAINLLNQRSTQIKAEADALFRTGTKENIEAAREKYKELVTLADERFQKEVAIQRQQAQVTGQGYELRVDEFGKARYVLTINTANFERNIRDIKAQEAQQEKEYQELLQKRKAEQEKLLAQEKERSRAFAESLEHLRALKIFDAQGRVGASFGGDINKGLAEFDRRAAAVSEKVTDPTQRFKIETDLFQARNEYLRRYYTEEQLRLENLKQSRLKANAEVFGNEFKKAKEGEAEAKKDINNRVALAYNAATNLSNVKFFDTGKLGAVAREGNYDQVKADIQALRIGIKESVESISEFGRTRAPEALDKARAATQTVVDKFEELKKLGYDVSKFDYGGKSVENLVISLSSNIDTIVQSQNKIKESSETINRLNEAIGGNLAASVNAVNNSFATTSTQLDTVIGKVRDLNSELTTLKRFALNVQIVGQGGGGNIERKAAGGYIHGYGFPGGIDTVPAWLTKGEYVINAESTRQFYTQIVDINAGRKPQFFNKGGPVSVGDINIYLQGKDTPENNVRQFGRQLRRELRRGNIPNFMGENNG